MEDVARIALVEQELKQHNIFKEILIILYHNICNILDDPIDQNARVILKDSFGKADTCKALNDYMIYLGFEQTPEKYIFAKEKSVNKLKSAQAAIEKKIFFIKEYPILKVDGGKRKFDAANVLKSRNPFLLHLQQMFNHMLCYDYEEFHKEARLMMPIGKFHSQALQRMREHHKRNKIGGIKVPELTFDIALLMELLGWFKCEFFTWVNEPECERCGVTTKHVATIQRRVITEICKIELYRCAKCGKQVEFPRFNDPRMLLFTKRGRCGEWANCFTLMCLSLGYEARYVYDTTDHVWCEVYDKAAKKWVHVDPCESKLDTPLMYCHGWGKKISYVFAFSTDDLQDVTWRYTTNHKEVLSRRTVVSEAALLEAILALRADRQKNLSVEQKQVLAERNLEELVDLLVERKPNEFESEGRISGSIAWRTERGEMGKCGGHRFTFGEPGNVSVLYCTSADAYQVVRPGGRESIATWAAGVSECTGLFRKVESDWRQVYIARTEGLEIGTVVWRVEATNECQFEYVAIRALAAVYESGSVDWTVQFDEEEPLSVLLGETAEVYERRFRCATLRAVLSGGKGPVAWQHAQLLRQSLDSTSYTLEIQARVVTI